MKRLIRQSVVLIALTVAIVATLGATAFAEDPAGPEQIKSYDFESVANSLAFAPKGTSTVFWGTASLPSGVAGGSKAMWVAGNASGRSTYPRETSGEARALNLATESLYTTWFEYDYICPSLGGADFPMELNVASNDGSGISEIDVPSPEAPSWTHRVFSRAAFSRKPFNAIFSFTDADEGAGQAANGVGPSVDNFKVLGYTFGKVSNVVPATVNAPATQVALDWEKPATSKSDTTADSRTIAYRVWRRLKGTTAWTELTSSGSRAPADQYTDTGAGLTPGNSYEYGIQPWDPIGSQHGELTIHTVQYRASEDITPPNITVTGLEDAATPYPAGTQLTITYSATDNVDAAPNVSATLDGASFASGGKVAASGTHTLKVNASDAKGNAAPTKTVTFTILQPAPQPQPSAVTPALWLSVPATPKYASAVVSGTIYANGAGLNQWVDIWASTNNGASWYPATAVAAVGGRFSWTANPTVKTLYQAKSRVSTGYAQGMSGVVTCTPKTALSISAPKSAKVNKSFTVSGSVKPKHAKGYKVRIYREKKISRTKYKSYGYVTVSTSPSTSSSTFKTSLKLKSKGTWRLKVRTMSDSAHADTSSAWKTVTIK